MHILEGVPPPPLLRNGQRIVKSPLKNFLHLSEEGGGAATRILCKIFTDLERGGGGWQRGEGDREALSRKLPKKISWQAFLPSIILFIGFLKDNAKPTLCSLAWYWQGVHLTAGNSLSLLFLVTQ